MPMAHGFGQTGIVSKENLFSKITICVRFTAAWFCPVDQCFQQSLAEELREGTWRTSQYSKTF